MLKLSRRSLFALLPSSLLAKWWKPDENISKMLEEEHRFRNGILRYSVAYWVINGEVCAPRTLNFEHITDKPK